MFDQRKCVVCGCTDEHACDEGCEWILAEPMVCSQCAVPYMLTVAWGLIWKLEQRAAATGPMGQRIEEANRVYRLIGNGRGGMPTFRQIISIQGREETQLKRANAAAVRESLRAKPSKRRR